MRLYIALFTKVASLAAVSVVIFKQFGVKAPISTLPYVVLPEKKNFQ